MYVFFKIMFYCVYRQMSEIKNYYYYIILGTKKKLSKRCNFCSSKVSHKI